MSDEQVIAHLRDSAEALRSLPSRAVLRPDTWFEQSDIIHAAVNRMVEAADCLSRLTAPLKPCRWIEDRNGDWDTGCGEKYTCAAYRFPRSRGMKFCCYCGKPLVEGKP